MVRPPRRSDSSVPPRIDERSTAMAETKRMTAEQVVSFLLEDEGVDFLRESLSWVVQQLMEAEVSELIGAQRGERSEERLTHRNGYRSRAWSTRAGEQAAVSGLFAPLPLQLVDCTPTSTGALLLRYAVA